MKNQVVPLEDETTRPTEIGFLHEIGSRFAAADSLHSVLTRVVHFVSSVVQCDSCFIYVLENDDLVLRASKNPAPRRRRSAEAARRPGHHRLGGRAPAAGRRRPPRVRGSALPGVQRAARGSLRGVPVGAGAVPRPARRRHQPPAPPAARAQRERDSADLDDRVPGRAPRSRWRGSKPRTASSPSGSRRGRSLDRAKGILQRDLGITEEEAYLTIQRQSRQRRRSKKEIAEAILLATSSGAASAADGDPPSNSPWGVCGGAG